MKLFSKLIILSFFSFLFLFGGGNYVSALPDYGWAKTWGDPADESYAYGTAADDSGNVYVVGYFYGGSVDFNPGSGTDNHTPVGGSDAYVVKYDANGNYLWGRTWGSIDDDAANAVAVDSSGNVYITGNFGGNALDNVDFDGTAGVDNHVAYGNNSNLFISKYNADGTYGWSQTLYGTANNKGNGIAVSSANNIFVTGFFNGIVDFDPTGITENHSNIAGTKMFLTKYNTTGTYLWTKTLEGTGSAEGNAVATDTDGNAYVGGGYSSTIDFDPSGATDNYTYATTGGYITKYDSSGNYLWVKIQIGAGAGNLATIYGLTTDSADNVYSTGRMTGTIDLNPGAGVDNHISNGNDDIYIQKLDSNGDYVWAKHIGGTDFERGYAAITDSENNVYIGGYWSGTVDFDPGGGIDSKTDVSDWGVSMFATAFDSTGTYLWTQITNGGQESDGYGIAAYDFGVYLVGDAYGNVDFDPEGTGDIVAGAVDWGSSALVKWVTDSDVTVSTVTIDPISDNSTNSNTPVITGNATDTQTNITTVEYSINGGAYQSCSADDGTFDEINEDFTCTIVTSLSDGINTIEIRATDSYANTNSGGNLPEYSFTVDTTAPAVTINEFTGDTTTDRTPLITGVASDLYSDVVIVKYSIDGYPFMPCSASDGAFNEQSEGYSCQITQLLSYGTHTVTIRAKDDLSNRNSGVNLGVYTFTIPAPQVVQTDEDPISNEDDENEVDEGEDVVIVDEEVIPPTDTNTGGNEVDNDNKGEQRDFGNLNESESPEFLKYVRENLSKFVKSISTSEFADIAQEGAILTGLATMAFVSPSIFSSVYFSSIGVMQNLFIFLGLKKKDKPFGYVYNSKTKAPLSLAILRFYNLEGELKYTTVTNTYGVFNLDIENGRYKIEATKTGFEFPSQKIVGNTDEYISNVYNGDYIDLNSEQLSKISIPMDPQEEVGSYITTLQSWLKGIFALLAPIIFVIGLGYSIYILKDSPTTYNWLILLLYVLILLVYIITAIKSQRVGKVTMYGEPVEGVSVGLKLVNLDKVVDMRVTDENGKYSFIATKGEYQIVLLDKNYVEVNSQDITIEVSGNKPEVIYRDIEISNS